MPYQQFTLTEVLAQLADRYESTPFWTAAQATRAVNLALRQWNALTGFWRGTAAVVAPGPAAPDHMVPLPGSLTYRARVTIGTRPLTAISRFGLNRLRPNWMHEYTDSGGDVPAQVDYWAPVGLYTIRIWPGNRVNTTLTVDGTAATPVLVNPGDFINIGGEDLGAILDEALHLLLLKQGGARFVASLPLHQSLLVAAGDRNAILLANKQYRMYAGLDRNRSQRPALREGAAPALAAVQSVTRPEEG